MPHTSTNSALSIEPSRIPGCARIHPQFSADARGAFYKVYQETKLGDIRLSIRWKEVFFSHSRRDVIRGFHVLGPPAESFKLVIIMTGTVRDALLDLRAGSPTNMQTCDWTLEMGDAVLVAPGVAHGFCVLSDSAIVGYAVSTEYHGPADLGVRWDSAGFAWPCETPIVSPRDQNLPPLGDFITPFRYVP